VTLLRIDRLAVRLPSGRDTVPVLHDVSLDLAAGEALGLVGESGSGKSMTLRAVSRLLPRGAIVEGTVTFDGLDVLRLGGRDLRAYRAGRVANIFQDPRAHINPVRTIGDFLTEAMVRVDGVPRREAIDRAIGLLDDVGIADGERRMRQYPHQLSGGMLQRVMIAAALAAEPELLLADEPTTALDVTTQSEVMAILDDLRRARGMAMIFVTHDLDLAAAVCDRTAVMYAGRIVEVNRSDELHVAPRHPYSAALTAARPDPAESVDRLTAIAGRPVSAAEAPSGCAFGDRCDHRIERCDQPVELVAVGDAQVRCCRHEEIVLSSRRAP
jgi:oligopeptide/dipeptide ABC transporter ATP-binding protein